VDDEEERMTAHAGGGTEPSRGAGAWRGWLPRVLVESLLIVLSVLLALALDEWRDDQTRAERTEAALTSIRAELQENLQSVERARANHLAIGDSLERYAELGEPPPPRIYLFGIFNPAPVHATAWESALETGTTSDMAYELVLTLSRVYDGQARYRGLGDALVQEIMDDIRREGEEAVLRDRSARFITLDRDFAGRESALAEAYESALVELGGS
jgi:hypothetical protein